MIKRTNMQDYFATRISKAMTSMKIKEDDEVIDVLITNPNVLIITKNGYYNLLSKVEVPLVGVRGSGVKGIKLVNDEVVKLLSYEECDYLKNQN